MNLHPFPALLLVLASEPSQAGGAAAGSAPRVGEPTVRVAALRNGDFAEALPTQADERGILRVPWWRTTRGAEQLEARAAPEGDEPARAGRALRVAPGRAAEQVVAAYAPLAASLEVSATLLEGRGALVVVDGAGRAARLDFSEPGRQTLRLAERPADHPPESWPRTPRFVLRLESDDPQGALFAALEASLELPCPSEADLRAELLARAGEVVDLWLERSLDDVGPRSSGFLVKAWDIVTGEHLMVVDGQVHPLFDLLLVLLEVEEVPRWRAALERFLTDWFELGFHPETGLPCAYAPATDERLARPIEIHRALAFLIELSQRGPEHLRAEALARARRIGEHVLARGVVPDGRVAPGYVPTTGEPVLAYVHLRALDVPAQLARLGALLGDERMRMAALEAVATLEYTHFWPGTWNSIDPGFDDIFGLFGARALAMWRAWPDAHEFRNLVLSGYRTYAPLWRDALRLGGNVAADQVRCWELVADLMELEPAVGDEVRELLELALHSHWIGEQYRDGAWGDVTIYLFEARDNLQVGDLPGVPSNLLQGLGLLYREELGLRDEATRGRFTAVLRSSVEAYRRPYGYLLTRGERHGANRCGGSLRLAAGMVEMLRQL